MDKKSTFMLFASMLMAVTTMTAQHVSVYTDPMSKNSQAMFKPALPQALQADKLQRSADPLNLRSDRIRHKVSDNSYDIRLKRDAAQAMRKAAAATTENTVRVSWEADYDPASFSPSYLSFINVEAQEEYYTHDFGHEEEWGEDAFMDIPTGTYDIFAEFWGPGYTSMYQVIREQVEITSDQHFSISPLEASQTIEKVIYFANGEEAKLPVMRYLKEDPWVEYVDMGNISGTAWTDFLVLKGFGGLASFFHGGGFIDPDDPIQRPALHISPCSDRFILGAAGYVAGEDGVNHIYSIFTDQTDTCTMLVVDPSQYLTVSDQFKRSPLGTASGKAACTGFNLCTMHNGVQIGGIAGANYGIELADGQPVELLVNAPSTELGISSMTTLGYGDLQGTTHNVVEWEDEEGNIHTDEWDDSWVTMTYSLPQYIGQEGIEYVNKGHDIYGNFLYQIPEDPADQILEYPGHPVFSYKQDQITDVYGNSCPMACLMMQNAVHPYYGYKTSYIEPCFIGRRGEVRMTDYQNLQLSLLNNEQEVSSSLATSNEDLYNFVEENGMDGKWEYSIVNTNIEVDDLSGHNTVKATFDGSLDDFTSPTLQMLDFRNEANEITDRFETAEQGTLQFAGGDFNLIWREDGSAYADCKPMTVKVEYSPYQQEAWTELSSIKEQEEYFWRPAFGYFYSGSLAEVNVESETAWYDLRITLTDESGNTNEQVICPAFKIGQGATSIRAIEQQENASVYTLQGQKVGNSIESLNAGMYIVDGKKVVKM